MFACEHAVGDARHHLPVEGADRRLPAAWRHRRHTDAVYDAFLSDDRSRTFFHGHSFTANPLACAVAIASLDLFGETDALGRVGRLEAQLRRGLSPLRGAADRRRRARDRRRRRDRAGERQDRRRPPAAIWTASARACRPRSSSAACCCGRSATCSTSCRPMSSRTMRRNGASRRSLRCLQGIRG